MCEKRDEPTSESEGIVSIVAVCRCEGVQLPPGQGFLETGWLEAHGRGLHRLALGAEPAGEGLAGRPGQAQGALLGGAGAGAGGRGHKRRSRAVVLFVVIIALVLFSLIQEFHRGIPQAEIFLTSKERDGC